MMKKAAALLMLGLLLLMTGCRRQPPPASATPVPPTEAALPSPTPAPTPEESEAGPAKPADSEELRSLLTEAIEGLAQPRLLDLSDCLLEGAPHLAVKNLYYEVLRERPELKYAYDLTVEALPDGLLRCEISYMPYKQGQPGEGAEVSSLQELIETARSGVGEEALPISITDPSLMVDDMSRALQQVGGGYMVCSLSRDASAVEYAPAMGYTIEECLTLLEEARASAQGLVDKLVTDEMSQAEKLETLYTWLTDTVKYDHRYYSDRNSMPFLSTTATGAFQDNLAICGGYAHALELLCEAVGLEVYTVSGQAKGEYHMWNIIRLDGQWRYYDPTFDRGTARFGFRHFGVEAESLAEDHQWDEALVNLLIS